MKYLDDLLFWVGERERIRIQRERGDKGPYTHDPVLQTYRFCNVRREDDRVTKWVHRWWLEPNSNNPNVEFAMGIARMVNLPDTLVEIGFPHIWDKTKFIEAIAARKGQGLKCWTSAYMITGGYSAGGEAKEVIIARVLQGLYDNFNTTHGFIASGDSLETMATKLITPGIGSFLSGQIVADIKWLPHHRKAKDWLTWCTPGPGSMLGLSMIYDKVGYTWSVEEFQSKVWEVREILRQSGTELDAQNTQNCLCELSKYIRAKHFGARLKSTYTRDNRPL